MRKLLFMTTKGKNLKKAKSIMKKGKSMRKVRSTMKKKNQKVMRWL